jgi:hypothetical protein
VVVSAVVNSAYLGRQVLSGPLVLTRQMPRF